MTECKKVGVIEVAGGVAYESYVPPGVECVIYDHDNLIEEGLWRGEREAGTEEAVRKAKAISEKVKTEGGKG